MKLTVLGSGQGLSGAERACSGYLVESQGNALVFDLGTGAFKNLQKVISPDKVNVLFFSHFNHADHVADFLGFLWNRKMFSGINPNEARQLNIFGPKGMETFVKKILELFPPFAQLNFPVWVEEMQYSAKKIFGFTVKSKPVKHSDMALGYRIEAEGKAIAYSGDSEKCDELVDLGKNAELLVLDCSFAHSAKKNEHMNAEECGEIAKEAGAKRLMLSHLFPGNADKELEELAAKHFSGEIIVAKDLLEIEV